MKRPRLIPLEVGLATVLALAVVGTAALIGLTSYVATQKFIRRSIRTRLENIATVAAGRIDPAIHSTLRTQADETGEPYRQIKKALQEIRSASPEIRFVYTYRVDSDGTVRFVVDAENPTSKDFSHVGDPYPSASPRLVVNYREGTQATSEPEFTTDAWGVWLSGYVPVRDVSGRVECGLALDLSAQVVREHERRVLRVISALCVASAAVVLLLGLWFARRITQPLMRLAEDLGRVQRLELGQDLDIQSSIREVVVMRDAVRGMKGGLRSFRKYVPADLVTDLIALGQEARLGTEKREIAVFFSDIADFTTLSEVTPPERLATELEGYFDGMTRAVMEQGGTVDKYIGDAIMAFWGAPRPCSDATLRACLAALACRERSRLLNLERGRLGLVPMMTRIGITTGQAIVGNIGYEARLNYTALGDTVNLASRLEGLNKHYGTEILVCGETWSRVQNSMEARWVDLVAVKGKRIPVRVYEVMAPRGSLSSECQVRRTAYETALAHSLERRWDLAVNILRDLSQQEPEDGPTQVLLARCLHFQNHPPPAHWDGSHVMTEK